MEATERETGGENCSQPDKVALAVFGALLLAASIYLIRLGAETTFFRDEWSFILYRDGHDLTNFLSSHDGQQVPGQTFVFVSLFNAVGLSDYSVYRLVTLPLSLGCSALIYHLAFRRMGSWGAIAPAMLVLLLGASYTDILWPLAVMGFAGASCFGLAAFVAAERQTRAGDLAACASLLVALSFSGVALPFVVGVGVGVLLAPSRDLKRLWVPGVPGLAYLAWASAYGTQQVDLGVAARHAPQFIGDIATNAVAGLTGLGWAASGVIAIAIATFVVVRLVQLRGRATLAWQAAAALACFWVLTALARYEVGDARAIRYIFPSVLLMVLLLVALAPRFRFNRAFSAAMAAVALAVLPHSVDAFRQGSDALRKSAAMTRAELGAAEIGRDTIPPESILSLHEYPMQAGAYFGAIARYQSSPAYTVEQLLDAPEYARERADRVLAEAQGIVVARAGPDGQTRESRTFRCRMLAAGESVELSNLSRTTALLLDPRRSATLSLRRFGERFQSFPLPADSHSARISAPSDLLPKPVWQGRVSAGEHTASVCLRKQIDSS